jgi:hypothetical protein
MIRRSKIYSPVVLSVLAIIFIISGSTACKKPEQGAVPAKPEAGQPAAAEARPEMAIQEGLNEVGGTVKSALGRYFYIAQLPGFDFILNGAVEGGDPSALVGKDVRIKAVFNREKPSVLVTQSLEVKEGENQFKSVYSSTDTTIPEDFFAQKSRDEYPELKITNINKSEDWEGKGKGKVFGKLISEAGGQGNAISILDEKGKEVGKVIVDSITGYANYYIKKLRLFDTFWFYLNIKESVPRNLRLRNRELFHADVVFTGLY